MWEECERHRRQYLDRQFSNHEKNISVCARRLQICCFSLGFIAFNPIFFPPHSHWDILIELLPGRHVLYKLPSMLAGWDCSKQAKNQESTVTVYIHSIIIKNMYTWGEVREQIYSDTKSNCFWMMSIGVKYFFLLSTQLWVFQISFNVRMQLL